MEYNTNFNKCEMAKYLITNAKSYVTNGTKIKIREFISEFKYPDFNTVLDIDRFITSNNRFDVTINGVSTISECELNPNIHSEILQRAVELAKVAYQGDLQTSVELGQRSE